MTSRMLRKITRKKNLKMRLIVRSLGWTRERSFVPGWPGGYGRSLGGSRSHVGEPRVGAEPELDSNRRRARGLAPSRLESADAVALDVAVPEEMLLDALGTRVAELGQPFVAHRRGLEEELREQRLVLGVEGAGATVRACDQSIPDPLSRVADAEGTEQAREALALRELAGE